MNLFPLIHILLQMAGILHKLQITSCNFINSQVLPVIFQAWRLLTAALYEAI